MNGNRQLDTPDDSLNTIEQLDDHSELSTMYPQAHKEWEGTEILSREERERKRDEEQITIRLSIRKWFPIIGLLLPIPFILIILLLAYGATYLEPGDMSGLILPAFLILAFVGYLSYRIIKLIYSIFYSHAIQATPIVAALLLLLALSIFGVITETQPLHSGEIATDGLIIGGAVIILSIIYTGILLFLWTSRHLSSKVKVFMLALLPIAIGASSWFLYAA